MAEITYIGKRTAVNSKPVPPGKHHNPSVLDQLMEKKHLKIVFYYPSTGEMEVAGEVTRMLRESLSEMLNKFPMVTGRLVKNEEGKWMIKCNDAGVRLVEARAKGSVEEWLTATTVDGDMELKLVHWEEMFHKPYFWSTFYVQITEFEGGGFAVGLSCYHLLVDPICATMFVKTWADAALARNINGPSLFHPQLWPINEAPLDVPRNPLINYYKSSMENPSPPTEHSNYKTIGLAFSDHEVWACMAKAQDGSPHKNSPSPFAALAGLFWACISKIRGKGKNELVKMSICLDTRTTLNLENDTFGNCMVYNAVEAQDLRESSAAVAVAKAVGAIAKAAAEMDDKQSILELIEWLRRSGDQSGTLNNGSDLICMSLEGSAAASTNPYLTTFGGGVAPIRVSYYVEPMGGGGQVLILPAPPGEGRLSRVVMVTVEEDEAVKLLEDGLILSFHPTVLIGMDNESQKGSDSVKKSALTS